MKGTIQRFCSSMTLSGLIVLSLLAAGCSSFVRKEAPTIAHIHIGHAITGFDSAPNKQGLLVVAELAAVEADTTSQLMRRAMRAGNMDQAKRYLKQIAISLDPETYDEEQENGYGILRGTAEAMVHLKLAADVPDATSNVRRTVAQTNIRAQDILDRADGLAVFVEAGLNAVDKDKLVVITEEVAAMVKSIASGPETPELYGLYNLREDIEAMINREDPPYETVDSYYLFNLVKLPDGQWGFGSRRSRGSSGSGY